MDRKVVLVVLDSVGIGELPDAKLYGDEGSNTLGNIAKNVKGFSIPNGKLFFNVPINTSLFDAEDELKAVI